MLRNCVRVLLQLLFLLASLQVASLEADAREWQVGFARIEVTPEAPLRLSGYSNRNEPHVGVADALHVRAMVLSPPLPKSDSVKGDPNGHELDPQIGTDDSKPSSDSLVLVSMDSILATADFSSKVAQWLEESYGLRRSQLAVSSTHSHTAPQLAGGLKNLLAKPQTAGESAATKAYTDRMFRTVQQSIRQAFKDRQAAKLEFGQAEAQFAVNRRVIRDGVWAGFGEQENGQTDHRVRVLLALGENENLLGGAYLYACHCTTLGPSFNKISGDWAGLSASRLESIYSDATFLPIIGCGADANPNPRDGYDFAVQHATEMVDAVTQVIKSSDRTQLQADSSTVKSRFGFAGISPDRPTDEYLEKMAGSNRAVDVAWAEHMRRVRSEMGRLPESYPMPIHTWQFGEQLSWVFLGGEVVVDYQFQIEKELPTKETWVAAYTDDVFAYVASEAMRPEGGYEVDASMIFYLQPGRWQSGTQALILRRVKEIFEGIETEAGPLSPEDGLSAIEVPEGFQVELVASEPTVADPINVAFGPDGSAWVVEMADYPLGNEDGGRVKRLSDSDGDGVLEAQRFLDGLAYPTSVYPWREGVLVIAAPDVIWAVDRDGDGKADEREVLLSGIHEANPQHRASGFELGLDGWLHFGAGHGTQELTSHRNGEVYNVRGHDLAWNPDTGEVRLVSGETQFVRSRDNFGNWFGNSNSQPIYQYVIEQKYLRGGSVTGGVKTHLLTPATAPPVFPSSNTKERFNDLYAFNRFTSACSSIIGRVPGLGPDFETTGLICEPVHNLVARIQLRREGAVWKASRHPGDEELDFFTSKDSWSRPVRVINAPDGSVWVVDMLRKVIEHPEWIPTAWQESLNVRDGSGQGRIYRVFHDSSALGDLPVVTGDPQSIVEALSSENGAIRDLGLLQLLWNDDVRIAAELNQLASQHGSASVRAAALGALESKGWLDEKLLAGRLSVESNVEVLRLLIELAGEHPGTKTSAALRSVVRRDLALAVDLQWVLTIGRLDSSAFTDELDVVLRRSQSDPWVVKALELISDENVVRKIVSTTMELADQSQQLSSDDFDRWSRLCSVLWSRLDEAQRRRVLAPALERTSGKKQLSASSLLLLKMVSGQGAVSEVSPALAELADRANSQLISADTDAETKLMLVNLIGGGLSTEQQDVTLLDNLFQQSNTELRMEAIRAARRVKSDAVPDLLTRNWSVLTPTERAAACGTMLSNRSWVAKLVSALESEDILPQDLDPATVQQLRGYWDRSLRTRCLSVFGKPTPRSEVVQAYLADLPTPELNETGAALFKQHCAACHQERDGQPAIAPALENLKHWTLQQWVTGILDPNRNVEPKYHQSRILTADDQVLSGIVVQDGSTKVQIVQPDGSTRSIPRNEIVEVRESRQSLMPEGFEAKLSPDQLAQLLGYLRQK